MYARRHTAPASCRRRQEPEPHRKRDQENQIQRVDVVELLRLLMTSSRQRSVTADGRLASEDRGRLQQAGISAINSPTALATYGVMRKGVRERGRAGQDLGIAVVRRAAGPATTQGRRRVCEARGAATRRASVSWEDGNRIGQRLLRRYRPSWQRAPGLDWARPLPQPARRPSRTPPVPLRLVPRNVQRERRGHVIGPPRNSVAEERRQLLALLVGATEVRTLLAHPEAVGVDDGVRLHVDRRLHACHADLALPVARTFTIDALEGGRSLRHHDLCCPQDS